MALDAAGNLFVAGTFVEDVDLGGGKLTAGSGPRVFVGQLDAHCDHVWSKAFEATVAPLQVRALQVDSQGSLVVGGTFDGTIDFGGGPLTSAFSIDAFVAKGSRTEGSSW